MFFSHWLINIEASPPHSTTKRSMIIDTVSIWPFDFSEKDNFSWIWVWVNTYRYIFSGMNIHLPAILGFTRYQGFDPSPFVANRELSTEAGRETTGSGATLFPGAGRVDDFRIGGRLPFYQAGGLGRLDVVDIIS